MEYPHLEVALYATDCPDWKYISIAWLKFLNFLIKQDCSYTTPQVLPQFKSAQNPLKDKERAIDCWLKPSDALKLVMFCNSRPFLLYEDGINN